MKKLTAILLTLCLLLTLTACGGSSKETAAMEYAMPEEAPAAMDTASSTALSESGSTGSAALPDNRKWIITVDLSVETDDLETLQEKLNEKIAALQGYVEDQNFYNGSTYSSRRYRHAELTVRIPAEQVENFTEDVEGIANVVSNNLRREDITLQYVDTESRVTALKTEEARLLELMSQAETMVDLLEIEARLTDVRYELESYASRLRTYDNQINYATIYLYIEEVQEYTPVEEPTLWERISNGFKSSLKGLGESLQNVLVFVIIASPYLLVYGGIVLVILLIVRKARKVRTAKKQPRQEEQK